MQRVAVLGLGAIAGKAYLPLLSVREGIELLTLSRNPETVANVQERYRVRGTTKLDDVLSWHPHAAFVLTPSSTHAVLVAQLLDGGADVFVEKPATLSSRETRALAEQADRCGRILMVGFNRRYAPLHRRARELWGGRAVGLCLLQKHREGATHPDLFANYIDDTIHVIDLLRFFCGEGEAVRTLRTVRSGRLLEAVSLVALESGGQAVVATSLEAGGWRESCSLHGAGASLELAAFSSLRLFEGGEERSWHEGYAKDWTPTLEARGFPQQIDHFFACVATRQAPSTSAWDALRTQILLEAMVARADA